MENRKTSSPGQLQKLVGETLGASEWLHIDQQMVNAFADLTRDHQFIHVDPERAAKTPMGTTIVHGFFTLSLLVHLTQGLFPALEGSKMVFNYGFDKIRFLSPVPAGSDIRAVLVLRDATEKSPGQWLLKAGVTVEIKGGSKPALVADWLMLDVTG